ncbi:MAG: Zn-dependent oligopeptidase [Sphingomonadales bacterium]|nr:Zn-dependent oligopeptidase [Sphingomonadales bacterium]
MNRPLIAALLAAVSTPALAAPTATEAFLGDVIGAPKDAAQITARCDAYVTEAGRRHAALAAETGPATLARTLVAYDDLTNLLGAAGGEMALYRETGATDALRKAGQDCEVRLSAEGNKLSLSRPVYDRLKAIPMKSADAATKLYLTRVIAGFDRSGIGLPADQRAKAQALADKAAELGTAFTKNIADGRKTVTADPAELDGLPADFLASHKPGADGKVVIATDYTDLSPVMTYAKSDALRERLDRAYLTRAYPMNDAVLKDMLNTRNELAHLLGRKDFATLAVEDKMLDTPEKVDSLLTRLGDVARPAGQRDYARKLALYQVDHPGATAYHVWDGARLSQQIQKRDYSYDSLEARQYFNYVAVRDGILKLTEDLFGVSIKPWNTPVWDPGVEAYEMYDAPVAGKPGKLLGRFYFDSHPRPGKYEHANAMPLRNGIAGRSTPVAALVMNLPAGRELMEHDDVETFLHEYGHLLHNIFGGQTARWAGQSGVATEWDFVEAPSQMLEEWVYDYDTIARFARNADGKVIPRELVEKMNKARYFDRGMQDMRQFGLSNISLNFHRGTAPADPGAAARALDAKFAIMPYPEWVQMQDAFPHLAGYSAYYYTYQWSKVIADDLFTEFRKHGLRDAATARRYRALVLTPGGTRPAAELVQSFLGRPISLDAYKAELAKDQ